MYKFIATLSVIIRTFYLPNPFDSLGTAFPVTIGENTLTILYRAGPPGDAGGGRHLPCGCQRTHSI